jgi:L-2-hydroxyglutarate oxidase LhgO
MDEVECVVVGAGVMGLAAARALAPAGYGVLVPERGYTIGFETSSRNSEVIHGGLYYPTGSLKARSCVTGRQRLYSYCGEHGVPHAQVGKLIVATSEAELPGLDRIAATARGNGVHDLEWLNQAQAQRLEAAGAMVVLRSPVLSGKVRGDGFDLTIGGDDPTDIRCRFLVNAAGLYAPALAHSIEGVRRKAIPPSYFCRGVYFTLTGHAPFRRLIYPVPIPGGLGVHVTLDLAGQARFGPDVEWILSVDYTVDPARGQAFYAAVRTYWPGLRDGALRPGYAGLRPKISGPADRLPISLSRDPKFTVSRDS